METKRFIPDRLRRVFAREIPKPIVIEESAQEIERRGNEALKERQRRERDRGRIINQIIEDPENAGYWGRLLIGREVAEEVAGECWEKRIISDRIESDGRIDPREYMRMLGELSEKSKISPEFVQINLYEDNQGPWSDYASFVTVYGIDYVITKAKFHLLSGKRLD